MSFFPTTVIVGTDGSAASRHALEAGVELARATGSDLHLLHVKVTSSTVRGRPMTPQQRETTEQEGEELLAREAAAAAALGCEVAGTHLRHGEKLERVMTEAAAELGAGLLVVGEGRAGRLDALLSSSFGTSTVRRSKGSVLVVR
jgi:nucleotide-binding universal stress UspA family protein